MEKFKLSVIKEWSSFYCLYKHSDNVAWNIANILVEKDILDKIQNSSTTLEEINNILSNLFENSHKYKKIA